MLIILYRTVYYIVCMYVYVRSDGEKVFINSNFSYENAPVRFIVCTREIKDRSLFGILKSLLRTRNKIIKYALELFTHVRNIYIYIYVYLK